MPRWLVAGLALLLAAGCTTPASGRPAVVGPAHADLPIETGPVTLTCADAAKDVNPPAPGTTTVAGLAADWLGGGQLDLPPGQPAVLAGDRRYFDFKIFVNVLPAPPETTVRIVSGDALLYYTRFVTWSTGDPHAPPVPHGVAKEFRLFW